MATWRPFAAKLFPVKLIVVNICEKKEMGRNSLKGLANEKNNVVSVGKKCIITYNSTCVCLDLCDSSDNQPPIQITNVVAKQL